MAKNSQAARILAAFGGLTALAKALGAPVSTIQGWKTRGSIPESRHGEIIAAAGDLDIPLSASDFIGEAALGTSGGGPLPARPQTGPQRPAPGNDLTQLGRPAEIAASPEDAELECVPNPKEGTEYLIRFTAAEFTSLCPVTGQPDFAHLVIDYVPDEWIVESKSLKLYLSSFRNHGAFHEDCTITIAEKIITTAEPHWIRIGGYWYPRGGIPIDVFFQSGSPPEDLWLPDQDVAPYRGRG